MITKLFFILGLTLSILSCSAPEKKNIESNYNKKYIEIVVDSYLESKLSTFQDSMDSKKGILGYKNIIDYFSLGREDFEQRTLTTWNEIYDKEELEELINRDLKSKTPIIIELKNTDNHIKQYIHKVGISTLVLIGEGFFEWLFVLVLGYWIPALVIWIYVFYKFTFGVWKRMSGRRSEMLDNMWLNIAKYISPAVFVIFLTVSFISGDFSDTKLKNKIKVDIQNDIITQIDNKINN